MLHDLSQLTKTRMWIAIAVTIIPGLLTGHKWPEVTLIVATIIGTSLVAISSFVFNQLWEINKDRVMERTMDRPLPTGRISVKNAIIMGCVLFTVGALLLFYYAGALATILAISSFVVYVFLYTILLKPRTTWNTVVGGFSGAVGPLIGEAAVHNEITILGWSMFGLLFIWQPPHFWTLAIRYKDDYAKAKILMLPVVYSLKRVYINILVYQALLLLYIVSLSYYFEIFSLYLFSIPSLISGSIVWFFMYRLYIKKEKVNTMKVFYSTIFHMLLWHILISIDLLSNT